MISEYEKPSLIDIIPPIHHQQKTQIENVSCIYSVSFGSDLMFQPLSRMLYTYCIIRLDLVDAHRLSSTSISITNERPFTHGATVHCSFILMTRDTNTLA